jgi:hypothetical protein
MTAVLGQQTVSSATPPTTTTTTISPPPSSTTLFQSTNDSFSIQVPNGWIADDRNNTGFELSEEIRLGYGLLAQLCPDQVAEGFSPNIASTENNATSNNSCQGAQEKVVHVIRYPDLLTRIQLANNITAYHLEKLREVGYNNIQIVNSSNLTVNVTNPLTNQTVTTEPAQVVEMRYSFASSPSEARTGYFILTATNWTAPNAGTIKGYAVFYEDNSAANTTTNADAATAQLTRTTAAAASLGSSTLSSYQLSPAANQIFDSFELIAAPEVAQALLQQGGGAAGQTGQGNSAACHPSYPDNCIPPPLPDLNCGDPGVPTNFRVIGSDPHGFDADNDGIGCDTPGAAGGSGTPASSTGGNVATESVDDDDDGGGDTSCHPSYPDNCIPPPPPDLNCDDVDDTNFRVVGSDPHGFDGNDNDGIGCESDSGVPDDDDDDGGDDDGGDDDGGDDGGGEDPEPEPEPEPGDGGGDDNGEDGGESGGDDTDIDDA